MSPRTASDNLSAPRNYLNQTSGILSWLLTKDHKRIGILYALAITFFFAIGGLMAALIRIELATPAGDLVQPDTYNRLFTMHGVFMVFFFLIPSIPATLGNFLLPLMLGAKDVAFPPQPSSWYVYMAGGTLALIGLLQGGADTGWTFYTPFSTSYSHTPVTIIGLAAFVNGFSSILTGVNFLATIHRMRAPGLTWFRLPLFVWSHYATSLIMILGTPVIAITLLLLVLERNFHIGIFDPQYGGDPVLFQHLFWFYSHPAVYIMILPGMGVISEIIAAFCRKRIFGYKFVAFSSLGIAIIGFLVWGHHMFIAAAVDLRRDGLLGDQHVWWRCPRRSKSSTGPRRSTRRRCRGKRRCSTPSGSSACSPSAGLTGVMLAVIGIDVHVTDTYFVIAHFHYVMVGGTILAYLGGLHYWWPKITGRMYSEFWSKLAALTVFIGFNLTFFPQFILGYLGHAAPLPRLPRGVAGPERAVFGRRHGARLRVPAAVRLPGVVDALGQAGVGKPLGRRRSRVGRLPRRRRPKTST